MSKKFLRVGPRGLMFHGVLRAMTLCERDEEKAAEETACSLLAPSLPTPLACSSRVGRADDDVTVTRQVFVVQGGSMRSMRSPRIESEIRMFLGKISRPLPHPAAPPRGCNLEGRSEAPLPRHE